MSVRRGGSAIAAAAVLATATATATATAAAASTATPATHRTRVIVLGASATGAVPANDGTVERDLNGLGGVIADVPADRVSALQATTGVRSVSADHRVDLATTDWDPSTDA